MKWFKTFLSKFSWRRAFTVSLTAHFLFIAVLIFSPIVKPNPVRKVIDVKLLPPMQMVPVPEVRPEKVPEVKETPLPPKPEIKKSEIFTPKPKKKKIKKRKRKIKKRKVKKEISPQERRRRLERKLNAVDKQAKKRPASSGVQTAQYFPFQWYLAGLQNKITECWVVPGHFARKENLFAFVSFRVARDGSVSEVKLKSSSGMRLFDQSALQAVRSASPFPPLPDKYKEPGLEVTIQFKLKE